MRFLTSGKQSIADRAEIYLRMASDIWNPDAIKEIAGGNNGNINFLKMGNLKFPNLGGLIFLFL